MKVRTLDSRQPTFDAEFAELVAVDTAIDREIERVATGIVDDVKARGDAALLEYTNRFDRMRVAAVAELEIPASEMQSALEALPNDQRAALETAARRIRAYHEHQVATTWTYTEDDGTELGQRVNALDSVGLYVPGGLAAYPSSLLMNALPAHVAGVDEIVRFGLLGWALSRYAGCWTAFKCVNETIEQTATVAGEEDLAIVLPPTGELPPEVQSPLAPFEAFLRDRVSRFPDLTGRRLCWRGLLGQSGRGKRKRRGENDHSGCHQNAPPSRDAA